METKSGVIIVEGQFDIISLHQAGYTNTIALSGTGNLGDHLLEKLSELTDTITLMLDNDEAGWKATQRIYEEIMRWNVRKRNYTAAMLGRWVNLAIKNPMSGEWLQKKIREWLINPIKIDPKLEQPKVSFLL